MIFYATIPANAHFVWFFYLLLGENMSIDRSCEKAFGKAGTDIDDINVVPSIKQLYEKPEISVFSMNTIRGNPANLYEGQTS